MKVIIYDREKYPNWDLRDGLPPEHEIHNLEHVEPKSKEPFKNTFDFTLKPKKEEFIDVFRITTINNPI